MMKKFFNGYILLAVALIASSFGVFAAVPAGYYDGISGLKDSALKSKLHEIINTGNNNSYSGLFKNCFVRSDARPDGTWWDMYSNVKRQIYYGSTVSWNGMNREHSFPKSWWGGAENDAYTDLNHLYPSDGDANSAKNFYPLGEVDPANVSFDNGVSKVGTPVAGQGGGKDIVFEPADEYKGDFARTYFYMVTCYQHLTWKYTFMARQGDYPTLQGWAIDLLLKWHRADPVSDKEKARNDVVYSIQYNRNPFIDYPELVEYIWGNMAGKPFESGSLPPVGEGALNTPQHNSTVEIGDVVVGKTYDVTVPIRGVITEDLSLLIYGTNRDKFTIPVSSVSWKDVNGGGYDLVIKYTPTEPMVDNAKLLIYDGGLVGTTSYIVNLNAVVHDMPVFDRPVATEATNITDTGFRINWEIPTNPEVVDYYIININEYINGSKKTFSVTTDDDTNYYDFNEAITGAQYTYTVQSVRYTAESPESNVVTSTFGGVNSLSDAALAVFPIQNGVTFRCDRTHTNARIVDMAGRVVVTLPTLKDRQSVLLPFGVYLVYTNQSPQPVKVMVAY